MVLFLVKFELVLQNLLRTPLSFMFGEHLSLRGLYCTMLARAAEERAESMMANAAGLSKVSQRKERLSRWRQKAHENGKEGEVESPRPQWRVDPSFVQIKPMKCDMLSPRISPRLSVSGWTSPRNTLFQTLEAARHELDKAAEADARRWITQGRDPPPVNERTTRFAPVPAPIPRNPARCRYGCACCAFPEESALRMAADICLPYKERFARLAFPDNNGPSGNAASGRTSPRALPHTTTSFLTDHGAVNSSRILRESHKANEDDRSRMIWDEVPLAPLPYAEAQVYWP